MGFPQYLAVIRKRWLSIVLIAAVASGASAVATLVATPQYTAEAQVYVSVNTSGTTSDLLQGSSFTQRQVKSYTDLASTPRVLDPVIAALDLPLTPDELAVSIQASSPMDTSLIDIKATDPDPVLASRIANEVAESLATAVSTLERSAEGTSPVRISTVREATAPIAPSSPNLVRNVALGLVLGLAAGFGLAVLRSVLDTRVRTTDDVRALTNASIMAAMVHEKGRADYPLVVQDDPHSPRAEAFRRVRTNLQFLDVADELTTMVVTSSLPTEGKSTVAINLAITLADAGSRVILVDADLRRPSVAEYLGIEGRVGLTTVLIGQAELADVVQPWGTGGLHVLPSGRVPPNPSELVGSHSMGWLVEELARQYDIVVIDTPPLLPVTDAAILARLTDGALLVAGANRLHRHELRESLSSLEAVGARLLGLVVNHLHHTQTDAHSYSYYGSAENDSRRRSAHHVGGRRALSAHR